MFQDLIEKLEKDKDLEKIEVFKNGKQQSAFILRGQRGKAGAAPIIYEEAIGQFLELDGDPLENIKTVLKENVERGLDLAECTQKLLTQNPIGHLRVKAMGNTAYNSVEGDFKAYKTVCDEIGLFVYVEGSFKGERFGIMLTELILSDMYKKYGRDFVIRSAEENTVQRMVIKRPSDLGFDNKFPVFVTNENLRSGAASILVSRAQRLAIHEEMGEDYYIIPTSAEEVVIVPLSTFPVSYAEEMLENSKEVVPEEIRISDKIFICRENGEVEVANG